MIPSAEDWDRHELDKLLFEYLEGNLSEKQMSELEQKVATDSLLGSEMEYWKDTVVTTDFYDTTRLEQKLLLEDSIDSDSRRTAGTTKAASLYLFALLLCFCSLWPLKLETDTMPRNPLSAFQFPLQSTKKAAMPVAIGVPAKKTPSSDFDKRKKQPPVSTQSFASTDKVLTTEVNPLKPVTLPVSYQILEVTMPELAIKKLAVKKTPVPRTISRKQVRQIARMKERALQRRKANEFLKGRVPYVVPLNTRNF